MGNLNECLCPASCRDCYDLNIKTIATPAVQAFYTIYTMKLASTLSFVTSSLLLLELASAIDPCTKIAQWNGWKGVGGWEESKACLESFPFNRKVALQTLDTLIDGFNSFYVFKDIAASPPKSHLSISKVDIIKELGALKNKDYQSDFAFQNDIQNIVFSLYDAHVNYEPNCYGPNWFWQQALLLYAPVEKGAQKLKIYGITKGYLPSVTTDLIECEVVEIDDKPGFEVIIDYAKEKGGKLKDLNVRLNVALMTTNRYINRQFTDYYGSWQVRHQLPEKPLTKYKLSCPNGKSQTMTLPWIVFPPTNVNFSDSSYYAQECALPTQTASKPRQLPQKLTPPPRNLQTQLGHPGPADTHHQQTVASNFTQVVEDEMFYFGYYLKGNGIRYNTGVIHIDTFEPSSLSSAEYTFIQGIKAFLKLGIEKVVLDVQNNGAQALLHVLFNDNINATTPDLEYATDILVSSQSLILGKTEASYPNYDPFNDDYYSIDGKLLSSDSWLTNSIKYNRGGRISRYSQRVRSDCSAFIYNLVQKLSANGIGLLPWTLTDYTIVSNGNCGSSCALFTNRLHQLKGVKTIAVGGILNISMS
ncbi:hypothetical protein BC937DRAFT_94143, partial [Endogone sp. FLAS-F59071]